MAGYQNLVKHPGYMKDCGLDMQLILQVMKTLTILQQINVTLLKQLQSPLSPPQQSLSQQSISQNNLQTFPSLQSQTILSSSKFTPQQNQQIYERIDYLIELIHHQYVGYHQNLLRGVYLFVKYRFYDVAGKFHAHTGRYHKLGDKKLYLNIEKNLFLKTFFIEDFLQATSHYLNEVVQTYPIKDYYLTNPSKDLDQLFFQISHLRIAIQLDYAKRIKISGSRAVRQLRNLVDITSVKSIGRPFLLGFWVATVIIMISVITFLIIYFDINFSTSMDFENTFPIWRGLSYFILYIWLLGINTYIFNYFKINFYLFTAFNNFHLPSPVQLFICGAMFTSIHLFLFLIYLINLSQLAHLPLKQVPIEYLPGISWLIFISFFIIPYKKFYFRQRYYPILMLIRALLSPIMGVQYKFIWITDVLISFRQPLRDIIYSIIYYTYDKDVGYRNTIGYQTIVGLVLFAIKIMQNIRQMYQNRLFGGLPIYGILRSVLNAITMITSYLSRRNDNHQALFLYIWLVTALVSTIYAYYIDLKNDWMLLDKKHGYLRQKLIYRNKKLYYSVILLNLLLRFVWTLNISPDILRRLPLQPYLIILVLSSLQICRRSIWMIFRVQRQHINIEKQLDNLFIFKEKEIEMEEIQKQQEIVIKSPEWLRIKTKDQDGKRTLLKQFRYSNQQSIIRLKALINKAHHIVNMMTVVKEKCFCQCQVTQ